MPTTRTASDAATTSRDRVRQVTVLIGAIRAVMGAAIVPRSSRSTAPPPD